MLFIIRITISKPLLFITIIVRLAPIHCVAPLAANNLQGGLSSASSVASSTLTLRYDRSFFIMANQEVLEVSGRPANYCFFWFLFKQAGLLELSLYDARNHKTENPE